MTVLTQESLQNVQGNILAPFNQPVQCFLFVNFRNAPDKARTWLAGLVDGEKRVVASTADALKDTTVHKAGAEPEKPYRAAVALTASALVTLNLDLAEQLVTFDAFWQGALANRQGGFSASSALVGDLAASDPHKANWVVGGIGTPVDAILTLAADDDDALKAAVAEERKRATQLMVLGDQPCMRLNDAEGNRIEQFGFRDGISQPGIRGFPLGAQPHPADIAPGEFVLGYETEPGSDSLRPETPAWMRDGSFQVFLRLTQDVAGWRAQMTSLSASSKEKLNVAAKVIGRTAAGVPLATDGADKTVEAGNDFGYANDPLGEKTPRFAHIRKMYPRDDAPLNARTHRLLRRGIPFGPRLPEGADDDKVDRGLVFNGFMASIEDQFEYLMQNWASSPHSLPVAASAADGPDPLVGASDDPCVLRQQGANPVAIQFERCVRTTGAVYAFAPSIPALRRLGGVEAP